jgi:FkbM family methyltransferase
MIDYSQNKEQEHILSYFDGRIGTFLDLGANDGKTFSNTYALAQLGWSGLCVDASPKAFKALQETHKGHGNIRCMNLALANECGPVTLHEASDTLLSSLDPQQRETWKEYNFDWNTVQVEGVTFSVLMERNKTFPTFDFISMDIEGMDIDILKQINLHAYGVQLLCIEHGGRQAEIMDICKGWQVLYYGDINLILCR